MERKVYNETLLLPEEKYDDEYMYVNEKVMQWFRYAKDHIHAKMNVADHK